MTSGAERLALRWTIGNVSAYGFEALRLSLWGAWKLFGPRAAYAVCVNSLSTNEAQAKTGAIPPGVSWRSATRRQLPRFLRAHLDGAMSEGVAWKFAPVRLFPERYELALDNDCILWEIPRAIAAWLQSSDPKSCVIAADVRRCFGKFSALCGPEPRNTGIRGLPPHFPYRDELRRLLCEHPVPLDAELDEQGLQIAALEHAGRPLVVGVDEVAVCSPFPPHLPAPGSCGAHFVGLNAHRLPWELNGRPATTYIREHWRRQRAALYEKIGIRPQTEFSRPAEAGR
jgi:hypothetical protein